MSFISYAQNYEDVILWRALKHVEKGFYLDVGAWDPKIDSVTKAFYDAGWRGINIEPVQKWFARLLTERPEDINLQIVIGDKNGLVDFFEVIGTGLSTIYEDLALRSASENGTTVEHSLVPMRTLNSICEEHNVHEIHFLKVDAEGAECLVLQGLDLKKYRPWIILIEATIPGSQIENYVKWEPLLKSNGYLFAYFDGLNRFYVAEEKSDIADKLSTPPNIFDDFIKWKDLKTSQELVNLQAKLESVQSSRDCILENLNAVQSDRDHIQAELESVQSSRDRILENLNAVQSDRDHIQAELIVVQQNMERIQTELDTVLIDRDRIWHELDSIYHSKSYRILKPLREAAWFFRRLPGSLQKLKAQVKPTAFSIIHFIRMLPLASSLADRIKKTFPELWARSRMKMLKVHKNSAEQSNQLSSSLLYEDEQYFLNLFKEEIAKRKHINRGSA